MNTVQRTPVAFLLCAVALALAACSGVPRYVRGDLASRGFHAVPDGSRVAVQPALAAQAVDGPLRGQVERALDEAGYRTGPPTAADVVVWYRLAAGPERIHRASSTGFDARFGSAAQGSSELLSCPDRFDQRLTLIATRAGGTDDAAEPVWHAELCSDGGGRPPREHAARFAGELMKSFGMNRGPLRFTFMVTPAGASTPSSTQATSASAPTPATPPSTAETQETTALPPRPTPPPTAAPLPPTAATALPDAPDTPSSQPARETRATATPPKAAEDAFGPPGPTWAPAEEACRALEGRSGVGCAVVVRLSSGTPILELGYATAARAREDGRRDAVRVGGVFCDTAARHGLFDQAIVRLRAPGQQSQRSCAALSP